MADDFKKGDKVEWNSPQGKTEGKVKEKITTEKRVGNKGQKGTKVKVSNPMSRTSFCKPSPGLRNHCQATPVTTKDME